MVEVAEYQADSGQTRGKAGCSGGQARGQAGDERGLLITLCKKMEKCGRKWKIISTFVPDSVKENQTDL